MTGKGCEIEDLPSIEHANSMHCDRLSRDMRIKHIRTKICAVWPDDRSQLMVESDLVKVAVIK